VAMALELGFFTKLMRHPLLHKALGIAQTVSCCGLFVGVILLCLAMVLMKGSITGCEICLVFVALGFILPHAAVAYQQFTTKEGDSTKPIPAAEAAAQEATAFGPQLCVILALADTPGHAYFWQNILYVISAVAFLASIAACGNAPSKVCGAAIPPDPLEFLVCLLLDISACVSLVICFPHLNTWHLWALGALTIGMVAMIYFEAGRDIVIDLLDPLLVVRSDKHKVLPGQQREQCRGASRLMALVCAGVALWDILLHPLPPGIIEAPAAMLDENEFMMVRWDLPPVEPPGEQWLLDHAAEALEMDATKLSTQAFLEDHRVLIFKAQTETMWPAGAHWNAYVVRPSGKMEEVIDRNFPGTLNGHLCIEAQAEMERSRAANEGPTHSDTFVQFVGEAVHAHKAYLAACDFWRSALTETGAE